MSNVLVHSDALGECCVICHSQLNCAHALPQDNSRAAFQDADSLLLDAARAGTGGGSAGLNSHTQVCLGCV
jgi:hypothetical protein